jgi:geranylgeranylglycerol-phosphate geranylgeranyltransferase
MNVFLREKVMFFSAFSQLIRLNYSLFSALAVLLSGVLAGDLLTIQVEYLVSFSIVFFSAVGAFAFNDYFDFEVDKINKRVDRPLVQGLLPIKTALYTGMASAIIVLLLSLYLNPLARVLVIVSLPLFYLYSIRLKRILLVNNALIAGAYVVTILLGTLVSDNCIEPLIVYFAFLGFIVGLATEIMINIMDVEGDKSLTIETLSTRFSIKRAAQIAVCLYFFIVILDPLPFFVLIDSRLYLDPLFLLVLLMPILSYLSIVRDLLREQMPKRIVDLKTRVVITMQVGSLAYLLGVLF